ncbi:MAG: nucleotide exchange factor GrpE [Acetobacter sp.]|nr:nucleotide exchange factor GrpE [Acetobacter sp.]
MNFENEKLEEELPEEEVLSEEEGLAPDEHDAVESQENCGKLEEDYNKLKNDYIRLYAEMDNMKKRTVAETEKTIKFAVSSFAKELLGVADNMERAIAAMSGNKDSCAELLRGVELTQNELKKVFEKFGIKRFNHIGQKFDPNFERVVQEVEDKKAETGTILAELQAGYTIHDRILREAMVIVAR